MIGKSLVHRMAVFQRIKKNVLKGQWYGREILSVFFILVGFYFFRKEQGELVRVQDVIAQVHISWILWGILLGLTYIALQALMYVSSFSSVHAKITFISAVELYLKRNLIGIFLPAGGVTSQAFFKSIVEKQQVSNTKTNLASYIFVLLGIVSVVVVGIPVVFYLVLARGAVGQELYYLLLLLLLVLLVGWISFSLYKKGWWYEKLSRISPQLELILEDVSAEKISGSRIILTLLISVIIELIGIAQLYVAMRAVSSDISLQAAFLGYTVATIFLVISPFLKGIGAIEIALVYILTLFGFNTTVAASVTLLYRFFNFWLLVLAGIVSFLLNRENLLLRVFPSLLIFILGFVNILSGLSPAIHWRMRLIESYLPIGAIHASNDFVVAAGVILIVTSAFLLRGLRSTWIIALVISLLSMMGHIFKAIDYEEAIFTALVCIILLATRQQYSIRSNRKLIAVGLRVALMVLLACLLFGVTGFYFLNKRHFGADLGFSESVKYTLQNFLLLDTDLVPHTIFAKGFLRVMNVMGIGSIGFLFYTIIRPFVYSRREDVSELQAARALVEKYGQSSAEYFKTYPDKLIFTTRGVEGFIAYKVANDFAIALGMPVCRDQAVEGLQLMNAFERFCTNHGLKYAYYRVDQKYLPLFETRKMHALAIGQEAVIDIASFTMEGKKRQNLRTARNNLQKKGYRIRIFDPPVPANILQQMRAVSEDWLHKLHREEMVFSQGMFLEEEIAQQKVFILESPDGKIVAFLNLVKDYRPQELRYDLIRKLVDEYAGCLDYLMTELIRYGKENGYRYLNMGMAPMSGIEVPKDFRQRSIKFAYEKIKRFQHLRGLRNFKEKFDPEWEDKYLIYAHHFDLLLLPAALNKVMREF